MSPCWWLNPGRSRRVPIGGGRRWLQTEAIRSVRKVIHLVIHSGFPSWHSWWPREMTDLCCRSCLLINFGPHFFGFLFVRSSERRLPETRVRVRSKTRLRAAPSWGNCRLFLFSRWEGNALASSYQVELGLSLTYMQLLNFRCNSYIISRLDDQM